MTTWTLWILLVVAFLALAIYLYTRSNSPSNAGVIDVRVTPRREVEQMTVDEYWQLGLAYLEARGYEWIDTEEPMLVKSEERTYLVHYDPAGKAEDPRVINQIIVEQRKQGMEGLILITSAQLPSQSQGLTQRSGMKVLDPRTLVNWRRNQNTSNKAGTSSHG